MPGAANYGLLIRENRSQAVKRKIGQPNGYGFVVARPTGC